MALPPTSSASSERTPSPQLEEDDEDDPSCCWSNKRRKSPNSSPISLSLVPREIPDSAHSCSLPPAPPPRKRTKSPGVRVVGGRIFDSENGKTCHQCRQKTMDFSVACKSRRKDDDKPCTMKYCHKCLFNRYAEKAEAVNQLDDWKCPKCRGICNCSHCIRKRGYQPIGSLLCTAKATGFHSVLEMLTVDGPEKIFANLKKENVSDRNPESIPQPLYLPSPTEDNNAKENSWIKSEDVYDNHYVVSGGKVINTQSMESTKFAHYYIKDSPRVDTPSWEMRIITRPKWKQLARAKGNPSAQEGATQSVDILSSTSLGKEEKKIDETNGEEERSSLDL